MLQSSYKILMFSTLAFVTLINSLTNVANAETKFYNNKVGELKQNNYSYIGLFYERINFPTGLNYISGWLVGDVDPSTLYGVSHIAKGNQKMLWFQLLTTDKYGRNYAEVIDVINLPRLGKSEEINSFCLFKGVRDTEITAIIKYQNTQYFRNIKKAWRANRKSGKFEQISPQNIVCENLGWGI